MVTGYDEIEYLRANHPAWRLLRSNNVALVLAFLGRVFIDANAASLSASALTSELDDELYALNQRLGQEHAGEDQFPKTAAAYLDDWAAPERGWLRKHYVAGSDEAHYDLAPAVEKAMAWVRELPAREFIGTESRLATIFELLRQMVHGAQTDPEERLIELRAQRAALDEQIHRAERGDIDVLDAVGQRDRYQQVTRTARELLADFREVEENFRVLDRRLREQIASWSGSKGALLDEVLGSRSSISESDQGQSFRAFYDFLLSSSRRDELDGLLQSLGEIEAIDLDLRFTRIHFDWIDASERTQVTVRLLSEQLRRFLDDRVWLENRRVFDLLRSIETKAMRIRDIAHPDIETVIDAPKIPVVLPVERPLYRPSVAAPLAGSTVETGESEFDASALFDQIYIDREVLVQRVLTSLGPRGQIPLDDVIAAAPLEHGLAELIGYLSLHEPGLEIVFDADGRARIEWLTDDDATRIADLPRVTFAHRVSEER